MKIQLRHRVFVPLIVVLVTASGCEEASTDPSSVSPDLEVVFQEGGLVLGGIVYSWCDGWYTESIPPGDPILLDLYFPGGQPAIPFSEVRAADTEAILAAGGTILREFNVGVVRVEVPRGALAEFGDQVGLSYVRSIPDPSRFDVSVLVGYEGARRAEVLTRFEDLGGIIRSRWDHLNAFSGVIPDGSIPAFRDSNEALTYIELPPIKCLDGVP